jgi:hypothetical protein
MTSPAPPCGLCLDGKPLVESHLLPAALYKRFRSHRRNPDPVMVTQGKSVITSRHVKAPFLCINCERRFNENGKRYVLAQCARPDGQFKLRRKLQTRRSVYRNSRFRVYDVYPVLDKKIGHHLYFAAGIFWRAAAHPWKVGPESVGPNALDHTYLEGFRRYLLGEAIFPQDARVYVFVSSEAHPYSIATIPTTDLMSPGSRYKLGHRQFW